MGEEFIGMEPLADGCETEQETLADIIAPLIKPIEHPPEVVKRSRKLVGNLVKQEALGRGKLFDTLFSLGVEPYYARSTELGKIAPDLLPLRTVEEAWRIVTENQGLLYKAWSIMNRPYKSKEDDVQEGAIFLFETALFWDKNKGALSTYFISRLPALKRMLKQRAGLVKFSFGMIEDIGRYGRIKGRYPYLSKERIAQIMEVTPEKVEKIAMAAKMRSSSLNPLNGDSIFYSVGPDKHTYRMHDKLERIRECVYVHIRDETTKEKMASRQEDEAVSKALAKSMRKVLRTLPKSEKKIIEERFGIDRSTMEEITHEEVGRRLRVTREQVRHMEAKGLRDLRYPSRSKKLKSFVE